MKKFKVLIITAVVLLISIFIIIMQADKQDSTAAVMQKAFAAAGARIASSEIYVRGRLEDCVCEAADEQEAMLSDMLKKLGGSTEAVKPVFFSFNNDTGIGTEIDYIMNENRSIHASIINSTKGEVSEEYKDVMISLTDTSQRPEIASSAAALAEAIKSYGMDPEVNICITGSLEGNLNENELEVVCEKIFKSAGADKVEGMQENGMISVSTFSPAIGEAIRVNGRKVNLNVAVRYNSYEGRTYIWLATPVITTEY